MARNGRRLPRPRAATVPIFAAPNGDGQWADGSGLYAKALAQKNEGVPDPLALAAFLADIDRGKRATSLPIAPDLFEPAGVFSGGTTKQNGPQASFAAQPVGGQSKSFWTGAPPAVGELDYAVELAELYWASLLRDLPFTAFKGHAIVDAAINDLNGHLSNYRGPVDPTTKKITSDLLFRGGLPAGKRRLPNGQIDPAAYFQDEMAGPYVSQFCIWPTSFGAQQIDQKMQTYAAGQDYMTDLPSWYTVQRGKPPARSVTTDPMRRYMHNGRALAAFTRQDELYQAYFIAYLVLRTWQVPPNPGLPYTQYKNQQPFGTFGGPDIAATLAAVAKAALNAVWYQKWVVHLRQRPEAGGGLVHLWKTGAANLPKASANFSNIAGILNQSVQMSAAKYSKPSAKTDKERTFLLSQAFPEGSPPHPAYPTGHGTVAGACITALKFFFDCDQRVTNFIEPMTPAPDGLSLVPYTRTDANNLTINGELHKLAHNISFGHGIHAGIHWRSDTDESILLGEQIALSFLGAQIKQYPEKCAGITITKMDGTVLTPAIGN